MGVPEDRKEQKKIFFEEIVAKSIPNLMKTIYISKKLNKLQVG